MRIPPGRLGTTLAIALPALALAACSEGGGETAEAAPADQNQITASVQAKSESGMQGHVMITSEADEIIVKLEVLGLEAGTEYPAHLHQGSCAEGGEVVAELDSPTVASVGLGSSLTHLSADVMQPDRSYFVQVHRPDGTPVACADVRTPAGG